MNVLITGTNRGIGLGLVKKVLSANSASNLIATCRKPNEAKELQQLKTAHQNLHIVQLDVTDFNSYGNLVENVGQIVGNNGLHMLINNAGIAGKFLKIGYLKPEAMIESYIINTVAPTMLSKEFIPLLKMPEKSTIVNISSILGSISKNDTGGYYPYRTTKAGLNAVTKSLSIDLKNKVIVISLHPGWVKTEMGGPKAPLEVNDACEKIYNTITNLKLSQSGCFLNLDGDELTW